jgi:plasmid replication initiation protein
MAKTVKAKEDLIIKKPENLVKARYKLSPLAIKFLSTIITSIKRSDNINEEYVLRVKDFKELTGQKTKRIYELIEEALEDLLKNPLKIPLNEEQTKFLMCNWVSSAIYDTGQVSFLIDKRLRPLLLEIKEKFLRYKLENILPLKSSYSIRIYEILKDWFEMYNRYGNKAEKIISLAEFREILEIPKSYRFNDIKRQILNKAKTELEKHTDILFEYEEIKTGRKVTHLKFLIKPNPIKLQTDNRIQDNYFKSRKNFVALLRKNYSGNGKFFGFKTINKKNYWLGLDNNGLVYASSVSGSGLVDFNAVESEKIYEFWLKVAQNSELYKELISEGMDLKEFAIQNKTLWLEFTQDLIRLKEEGII